MDFASYSTLAFSRNGRVLRITLDRPDSLNAVDEAVHRDLARVFREAALDPESDVLILTGAGKAFSAGGNLEWLESKLGQPRTVELEEGKALVHSLLDCPKPIIARINGDAVGLGATLALLCDFTVAVDTARLGDPHVKMGVVAGDGGALIWPQLIGFARAKEFLLLGDLVEAPEAARLGLITRSVPAAELDATVDRYAQRLASGAQLALRYTKTTINLVLKQLAATVLDTGLAYEAVTMASPDHREAVTAFLEKRKPKFGP